ncbi:hypothetical protein MFIFM68171_04872 [Madurella fahalii]|uniref:Uncharacterized protein n=1 Tax=Madurella fahalii TaxID=1157608 RepID=A0ABQ0GA78_9PEZI
MTEEGMDTFIDIPPRSLSPPLLPNWSFELDQNNCGDNNISHHGNATPAADDLLLRSSRVETFLADPLRPFAISAEIFEIREHTKRALAEVDGMIAGLKFLDKVEREDGVESLQRGLRYVDDFGLRGLGSGHFQCQRWGDDTVLDIALDEIFEDAPEPNSPAQMTRDLDRSWRGLRSLRKGMRAEFQRFKAIASGSIPPTIRKLHAQLFSSRALADRGTLVYRDVLEGLVPDTLADIFAFASLSHAISRMLVRQKRMQEAQVLSGLQRWSDYIKDADERDAFVILASRMWPSRFASPPPRERPPTFDPHGGDHSLHFPNNTHFLQQVAIIASAEMGHLAENLSETGQSGISSANLEQDVVDVTSLTEQEFNFSLLLGFGDNGDDYEAPKDIDPREIGRFCEPKQPIPGYILSPLGASMTNCSPASSLPAAGCQITPPPPPHKSPFICERLYEFQITKKVSDCAVLNLRNMVLFLAVFAFVKDAGECFCRLSGRGKTVARSRTGSTSASECSKTERKLQREFFEPLKRAGADDACFLALLAVAKKFVVLGLFGTEEEVQGYLFTVSREYFKSHGKRAEFISWILGKSPSPSAASNDTPAKRGKRRNPSDSQLSEGPPGSKRQ